LSNSFRIGQLFGITIRVHSLFLWMMIAILIFNSALALPLALLFVLVVLHELGHSLVAQHFGIRVLDITLWPLGGMARMNEIPQNPRTEAYVAIAGPAVNFALAGLALPLLLLPLGAVAGLVGWFVWVNLMLGAFNLLPAFPMDGGRVLRAYLANSTDWVSATETAVRVGRWVAVAMMIVWIFNLHMFFLPLIAAFIWITGAKELIAVRLRNGQMPFAFGGSGAFGGAGQTPGGNGTGNPSAEMFGAYAQQAARDQQQRGAYESGPTRPDVQPDLPPKPDGGFSEDDIRQLERFHGRLRRPPRDA